MASLRMLWACVAHDYALHEVKNASVLARRLVHDTTQQEELRDVQLTIAEELSNRKQADRDDEPAS